MAGVQECLLEGYRVHPRDHGFIHLQAKYFKYGCCDTMTVLGSALPDAMTRDCLRYEIDSLQFRTGGHPMSFVVRIAYEAKSADTSKVSPPASPRKHQNVGVFVRPSIFLNSFTWSLKRAHRSGDPGSGASQKSVRMAFSSVLRWSAGVPRST